MTTMAANTPPQATAESERQKTASLANSYRVTAVAERLALHLQSNCISNPTEFFGLCLSLARGIDFAVANSEVPTRVADLPPLIKKICNCKKETFLQAAVMTLLVSVKSACKVGWFQEQSSRELCALANEIGGSFCFPRDINAGQSDPHPVTPIVMSKFYPLLKMGEILASIVVKPGYGVYVVDFQITKAVKHSNDENIRLFVVQTDDIESSACLINPPQVSFLLNGKGVDRRTSIFMDVGPQAPTNVTTVLKYGTNLLQAVGQFNAHYYIAVAYMQVMPSPEDSTLMDYLHPDIAALDPDSEIIEGPFRISLNCPISYKRIKTPVKGHSCKHLQCFDFSNYVDINSRRPSWRCPHCNQHVCYTDIRVDKNMVKVLSEVGDDVSEVIITADGSWKAIMDSDDSLDNASDKILNCPNQGSDPQDSMHVDLTVDDDPMDVVGTGEIEDVKPVVEANLRNQPVATAASQPSQLSNADPINRTVAFPMGFEIWSSAYSASNGRFAGQVIGGTSTTVMPSTVVPSSFPPPQNSIAGGLGKDNVSPVTPNQVSAAANLQLQQTSFVNSVSSEYGTIRQIHAHISRNPIAVQALPVPSQTPSPHQRMPRTNPFISPIAPKSTPTMTSAGNTVNTVSSGMNRQHPFPGPHINQLQNRNLRGQSLLQTVGIGSSNPVASAYRPASGLDSLPRMSSNLSQRQSSQTQLPRSRSPILGRSHLSGTAAQSGSPLFGSGTTSVTPPYARYSLSAQRATQMARPAPPLPVQNQTSRTSTLPSVAGSGTRTPTTEQTRNVRVTPAAAHISSPTSSPSEQDWRPAGRMRGSLSGRTYDAYKDLMIQPTQSSQPTQPSHPSRNNDAYKDLPIRPSQPSQPPRISNLTSPPAGAPRGNVASHPTSIPPHLQSRNRNVNVSQSQNNPTSGI